MKFRFGMILGFITGYVLGAKAGRARYEQIVRSLGRLMGTEPVQRATERGREYLGNGMTAASERIRSTVEK